MKTWAQQVAVKSNLLYDATATMNLGLEFGLARKWTLDIPFNYNPWKPANGRRLAHFGVQPEVRYWFCERFTRMFVGIHAHYADFNVGGWPKWSFISKNMQNNRYEGELYGAGFSFGRSWILKRRWSIEATFGVGYAPFSITDRLVLQTEEYINGVMKKDLPETGQDVKVMASRVGDDITMTVACAMIDKRIDDVDHYKSSIEQLYNSVYDNALKIIGSEKVNFKLDINTGDDYDRGVYYLTCTGMSQEMGDDGSVGRGNRCNGLITPYRPMSMEATSGKNPITHIGKIYNVMSKLIADDVAAKVTNEAEIRVRLLSQIGKPVSEPLNASVQIVLPDAETNPNLPKWKSEAEAIAADWLDNVDKVSDMIIEGKVRTF